MLSPLPLLVALASGAGASIVTAPHAVGRVVDALAAPERVARVAQARSAMVGPTRVAVVPVAPHLDAGLPHDKIAAFLARGRQLDAYPPAAEADGAALMSPARAVLRPAPPLVVPAFGELIVRGRVAPEEIDAWLAREDGPRDSRKTLEALARAVEGLTPRAIAGLDEAGFAALAGRFLDDAPARSARAPEARDSRSLLRAARARVTTPERLERAADSIEAALAADREPSLVLRRAMRFAAQDARAALAARRRLLEETAAHHASPRVAAFFPGMGNPAAYKDSGVAAWLEQDSAARAVYEEAAAALGLPPQDLLLSRAEAPQDADEAAGLQAAAVLTHNAALAASLARSRRSPQVAAFGGDSLGVLTAAAASGAVSVGDAARVARFLLPLLRRASRDVVSEPQWVLEVSPMLGTPVHDARSDVDRLAFELAERFGGEVESFGAVDGSRLRVVAPESRLPALKSFLRTRFPWSSARAAVEPTRQIYHSARLRPARRRLETFLASVAIAAPSAPIADNRRGGLITTPAQLREALLALVDEPVDTRATAATLDALDVDVVVALERGDKSFKALERNNLRTPVLGYDGSEEKTRALLGALPAPARSRTVLEAR